MLHIQYHKVLLLCIRSSFTTVLFLFVQQQVVRVNYGAKPVTAEDAVSQEIGKFLPVIFENRGTYPYNTNGFVNETTNKPSNNEWQICC